MTDPIRNSEATTQPSSQPTRIPRTTHATTARTSPIRPKIKNFTAHLGITIRCATEQGLELILESSSVEAGGVVR